MVACSTHFFNSSHRTPSKKRLYIPFELVPLPFQITYVEKVVFCIRSDHDYALPQNEEFVWGRQIKQRVSSTELTRCCCFGAAWGYPAFCLHIDLEPHEPYYRRSWLDDARLLFDIMAIRFNVHSPNQFCGQRFRKYLLNFNVSRMNFGVVTALFTPAPARTTRQDAACKSERNRCVKQVLAASSPPVSAMQR